MPSIVLLQMSGWGQFFTALGYPCPGNCSDPEVLLVSSGNMNHRSRHPPQPLHRHGPSYSLHQLHRLGLHHGLGVGRATHQRLFLSTLKEGGVSSSVPLHNAQALAHWSGSCCRWAMQLTGLRATSVGPPGTAASRPLRLPVWNGSRRVSGHLPLPALCDLWMSSLPTVHGGGGRCGSVCLCPDSWTSFPASAVSWQLPGSVETALKRYGLDQSGWLVGMPERSDL